PGARRPAGRARSRWTAARAGSFLDSAPALRLPLLRESRWPGQNDSRAAGSSAAHGRPEAPARGSGPPGEAVPWTGARLAPAVRPGTAAGEPTGRRAHRVNSTGG